MTTRVWTPEQVVGEDLARELIRAQFSPIGSASLRSLGQGFDNTAYLVDERYIFRFPRRAISVPLVEREAAILPLLARQLPLAIPVPRYAGKASERYPWPFVGYERLDGTTACEIELGGAELGEIGARIGAFLRALHSIDPSEARAHGLPGDEIHRLDHAHRLPLAQKRFAELAEAGIVADPQPFLGFLGSHPPAKCANPRIVHGDLYARHLLLDQGRRLTGVIDWGDMHFGDPALDLAIALTMLPCGARDRFVQAYGEIAGDAWERAAYRAIYHSALVAHYGHFAPDPGMLRIGLRGLELAGAFASELA